MKGMCKSHKNVYKETLHLKGSLYVDLSLWEINKLHPIHLYGILVIQILNLGEACTWSHVIPYSFWGITNTYTMGTSGLPYIYHFDTSDQREKPVYKSHIAHLSVQYK